ncbi:hypothetical protein [Massilia sp. H6]|uniref:hypothetical protein n=1 Tax=Massilia sp. H6 TaxID=2970464 RepID=UPI0021679BB7|nr:hypothetical protein [Massilia sp. H6]UVW30699.1 hypothetical protein NRS07_19880 [Massilia sp. H6]
MPIGLNLGSFQSITRKPKMFERIEISPVDFRGRPNGVTQRRHTFTDRKIILSVQQASRARPDEHSASAMLAARCISRG